MSKIMLIPRDDDEQRVADQDVREPPDVAAEAERQRLQEADHVRPREVQHQGERPEDRQDGRDREDQPGGTAGGQRGREVVGIERVIGQVSCSGRRGSSRRVVSRTL